MWLSCSRKLEGFEPDVCSRVDATHLVLKVISDKTNAHMRDRGDVLGNALLAGDGTGYYAYAFQDHIGILEQKLGFAVLGYVLTHEVGHLLLGSNSHAVNGIMSLIGTERSCEEFLKGPSFFFQVSLWCCASG